MQNSSQQLKSDSTSWQRTLTSSHNFTEPVTCREYTLPRDEKSSDPKGWIRRNTKIGPVLEVTTSNLQGKDGVAIIIESVNKDNSHSWVRISHGLNKLVTDLSEKEYDDNEQETSETKTEVFASASRSKAKAKPRWPSSACSSTRTIPIWERIWTEPEDNLLIAYTVSKRLTTLLRHGHLPRELDVLETNFSFAQFNRISSHFLGCRIKDRRYTRTWFMGSDRHSSSREDASEWSSRRRPVWISNEKENSWTDWWSRQCWFYFLKREFFSKEGFVVHLWRQRSSDQDDRKGQKPYNETCFQNPQSCAWLVIRSN